MIEKDLGKNDVDPMFKEFALSQVNLDEEMERQQKELEDGSGHSLEWMGHVVGDIWQV